MAYARMVSNSVIPSLTPRIFVVRVRMMNMRSGRGAIGAFRITESSCSIGSVEYSNFLPDKNGQTLAANKLHSLCVAGSVKSLLSHDRGPPMK